MNRLLTTDYKLPTTNNRVAIVVDWMYDGGGEKVIEQVHKTFPDAPIYASYCTQKWRERLNNQVVTGYLNNWPFGPMRKFLPILRQWWYARLDLSAYDVIISVTGNGEAKFIRPRKGSVHICYCHTPVHFYWRKYAEYIKNPGFGKLNWLARLGLKTLVKPLRARDYHSAQKVDYFIANSSHIANDIKTYYNRQADAVICPPTNTDLYNNSKNNPKTGNFIWWGRLVPDKRVDLAIQACIKLGYRLKIIARGPLFDEYSKKYASDKIEFVDYDRHDEPVHQLTNSVGFIFPSFEDFGISPIEALASGLPIIAYKAGGALDYVIEGKNGLFFDEQTVDSLVKVLKKFDHKKFDKEFIKQSAHKFDESEFRHQLADFVASKLPK